MTDVIYSSIPPETRLCFTVFAAQDLPKKGKISEFVFGKRKDET
jgi:hypothetical protein